MKISTAQTDLIKHQRDPAYPGRKIVKTRPSHADTIEVRKSSAEPCSLARKLEAYLAQKLEHDTSARYVAHQFGLSPRSMRRKLAFEGTNYSCLLAGVRLKLAKNYLTNTRMTIESISFILGYSDSTSFGKAFKKWVDITPSDYREINS